MYGLGISAISVAMSMPVNDLWARGAAVGNTAIGYKRRPTLLATETEPARGPFFDVIDEEKAAVIREVFERIAAGETASAMWCLLA